MVYKRVVESSLRLPKWDLVVFDEAHLAEAPTFRDTLSATRSRGIGLAPAFGLSATPGRRDDRGTESLIELFGRKLIRSDRLGKDAFDTLQGKGVLAKLEFKTIAMAKKSLARSPVLDPARFSATVELCEELSKGGRTLLFAGSVLHAAAIAVALRSKGVAAEHVSGAMPLHQRARVLKAFREGAVRVLCNKSLLATGYDCPSIVNVVLTVPVKSPILFEQIVGRASRGPTVGGNATSSVWYFDDHLKLHGKPSSYQRYALSGWM
jgi:superfamily II DNA or RNA helicase